MPLHRLSLIPALPLVATRFLRCPFAAPASDVQLRPIAGGDQPRPRNRKENHPALAAAGTVSRKEATAPTPAEGERVCRLPPTALERGLSQRLASLSRD